jgi:hypothetical protein
MPDGNCSNEKTVWTTSVMASKIEAYYGIAQLLTFIHPVLLYLTAAFIIVGRKVASLSCKSGLTEWF